MSIESPNLSNSGEKGEQQNQQTQRVWKDGRFVPAEQEPTEQLPSLENPEYVLTGAVLYGVTKIAADTSLPYGWLKRTRLHKASGQDLVKTVVLFTTLSIVSTFLIGTLVYNFIGWRNQDPSRLPERINDFLEVIVYILGIASIFAVVYMIGMLLGLAIGWKMTFRGTATYYCPACGQAFIGKYFREMLRYGQINCPKCKRLVLVK
jgi:DNA-directed RNA polymerase subunit RPC12/RpoP